MQRIRKDKKRKTICRKLGHGEVVNGLMLRVGVYCMFMSRVLDSRLTFVPHMSQAYQTQLHEFWINLINQLLSSINYQASKKLSLPKTRRKPFTVKM